MSSSITPAQILHIAKLARLRLSEGEVEKYAKDLGSILAYVDILKNVDTTGVEPTAQITDGTNILRSDVLCPSDAAPDALLATSPLPVRNRQIETPAAHG